MSSDIPAYVGFHESTSMPMARSDMTVSVFSGDFYGSGAGHRMYIAGGCNGDQACSNVTCSCTSITDTVHYFTPKTGKWESNLPAAPNARYRHMAATVGSKLYLIGGRFLNDTIVKAIDVFETISQTWSSPLYWDDAVSDGAAFSVGSTIYVVGGYVQYYSENSTATGSNGSPRILALDTTTNTWDHSLPPMPTGRGDISAQYYEGRYYVLGGWDQFFHNAITTVESYDVNSKSWRKEPSMLFGRGDLAVAVMQDKLFAIAGETKNVTLDPNWILSYPVNHVSRYTNETKKWYVEASIPEQRFRFVGANYNTSGDPLSAAIYLFGGQKPYNASCQCYRVSDGVFRYVPLSTIKQSSKSKDLSAGGIAGIVIAAFVVAVVIVLAVLSFIAYRQRRYFTFFDVAEDPVSDEQESPQNTKSPR